MFIDDEVRSALKEMYEYSPVDGFVEISEGLGGMIKSLANEPSVGLFYVQQHTHNAVPNVVNLKNNIVAKSREISLHTEDSEDSIAMVRSMTDYGLPIVDDMIKDIRKSLAIMLSKQPRKGLISSRSKTGSWGLTGWRGKVHDVEKPTNYWAARDAYNGSVNAMQDVGEELPVSSRIAIGNQEDDVLVGNLMSNVSGSGNFDEFKADKEERFEEWLEGSDDGQHKGEQ
ncbi:hypothetical protein L1987_15846 [Smallanthus sonchifolius]|uniref:Uncharacterized protein n=1 Tax=Smallanthus sonchifolius TaxID=185202 RepID=A0ACB9J7P7_9ASTR|nr:hypothetical protein L1987_15846 [Smallanthus sonchifolius]